MLNKTVTIPLESSAYYQATSPLNVRLWNQDKNTAILQFLITRNNFPLSLSKEHVRVIIALESGESFISSDGFSIDSEVEGVATYSVPPEFMAVATDVVGQIYVATLDNEEVIVQRKFTFTVENDLLSNIPSEEKIRYIKMFDDLKVEINNRLTSIETALTLLEQNIVDVNATRDTAITQINDLFTAKTVIFNDNYTTKMADLNALSDDMTAYGDATIADMVAKKAAFDAAVTGADIVTDSEAANWQKYKMTNEDGTRTYLAKGSFADVHALEPGLYETIINDTPTQGFPAGITNAAFVEIDVTKSESASGRKQIKVVQSSNSKTFVKHIHTNGADNGWKQVAIVDDLASLETVTGAQNKANVAENNAKAYADAQIAAQRGTLFNGSVSNVGSVINLTQSLDNFKMIVISGFYPGGSFSEIVVPSALSSSTISIQQSNISNASGSAPYMYELNLSITSSTKLTITVDVYHQFSSGDASGADANKFTIYNIEGIK